MARIAVAIAAAVVLLYAAACAWVYFNQRTLLYFPQATHVPRAATDYALDRGDAVLRGWALHREAGEPILYFGGNAEQVGANRADFARWFPVRAVYLPAYRGYGASDGMPSQDALFADALALYDAVRAQHPGQRISVIGRSLGSGVAAYVASHRDVARLALVTPYDSMVAVGQAHYPWLPVSLLARERFESTRWLRGYHRPVLVLQASDDRVVPRANTEALVRAKAAGPKKARSSFALSLITCMLPTMLPVMLLSIAARTFSNIDNIRVRRNVPNVRMTPMMMLLTL